MDLLQKLPNYIMLLSHSLKKLLTIVRLNSEAPMVP